jgi:hypothetical protein
MDKQLINGQFYSLENPGLVSRRMHLLSGSQPHSSLCISIYVHDRGDVVFYSTILQHP